MLERILSLLPAGAAIAAAFALAACSADGGSTVRQSAGTTLAGWYMEHAGQASFQPCGAALPLRVTAAADLPKRARAFGLEQDTPVYVRVNGTMTEKEIAIDSVEQFGSPVPVRDCALNGVVLPAPN